MKEAYPGSTLERLQHDCKMLEARANANKQQQHSGLENSPILVELVPTRSSADHLVQLYFDTFETTYHILHTPTFWADYSAFWDDSQGANSSFVALLLMMMATVMCTSSTEHISYDITGSSLRKQALVWIQACDVWLKGQSNKHRVLAVYQIRTLRILAASTSCLKTKEMYQNVQELLNHNKVAGLHHDPAILDWRCSEFEAEMRRRLWAITAELELQASIDRGTLSSLFAIQSDCCPPPNIDDKDYDPTAKKMPSSKGPQEYTASSYLSISSWSRPLRIFLTSLVNDTSIQLDYDVVLHYEERIMECLKALPTWQDARSMQASALLDLQLRQFLIILHVPFAQNSNLGSKSRYSKMVCFDTSSMLLDIHSRLIDSGNYALCLTRMDAFRAALCICHTAFLSSFVASICSRSALSIEPY